MVMIGVIRAALRAMFRLDWTWEEEEAFNAGFNAPVDAENPFTNFKHRRRWREGMEASREWHDNAW